MIRQPAWRVFASEYNDITLELPSQGEKTPSFVVSPLGAKINRVFVVGVLTDVEMVSEGGEFVRAHLSDPTGVFTIYSGQYQPEATAALQRVDVPAFVALVGKSRVYTPEEGTMLVSLRPEVVHEVDAAIRDQWILETCQQTKDRYSYMNEARKMETPTKQDLKHLGCSLELAEGIIAALNHYEDADIQRYLALIKESLQYLQPRQTPFTEPKEEKPPPPTVTEIRCNDCDFKEIRDFKKGDYVLKAVEETCPKCQTGMTIEGVYIIREEPKETYNV